MARLRFIVWPLTVLILLSAWFVIFGGKVFGPALRDHAEDQACQEYLHDCPRDEVRLQDYLYYLEAQRIAFNFTSRRLTSEPVLPFVHYDLFWSKVSMVFHTTNFPPLGFKPPVYDEARLAQIRSALDSLPPSSIPPGSSFRQEFHVAFYRGDSLIVDVWPKNEVPRVLRELLQALGIAKEDLGGDLAQ